MSYLVLARKYRPQDFDSLVGQEHITKGFRDSLESGRIGHAFLFCGPRGIGKTSCARILAKCLNCQQGPQLTPCGTCSSCKEITAGNSFDVIEIDAASNRGIDEIRTLRENVKFAPSFSKFKIYIIDEVHMLTNEAFNALLKTLEEPPAHVKFILATTEAYKIPATILSRCQRFDFKRISVETIISNLNSICSKEKIKIEEEALFAIAKAAQGSMRDALSIMDQLSSIGNQGVKAQDVYNLLGLVETDLLFKLTDALIAKDCVDALRVFDQLIDNGKDIRQLGRDVTEHYRHLMVVKVGGPSLSELIDFPKLIKERLSEQSSKISLKSIIKSIDIFIEAQDLARIMENWRMPFEIAFAKLTFSQTPISTVTSSSIVSPTSAPIVEIKQPKEPSPPLEVFKNWNALTHEVSQHKISLASYLLEGGPFSFKDNKLVIGFTKGHEFAKEMLETKENIVIIERAFAKKLGATIHIEFKIVNELPDKKQEQDVQKALDMFGGEVIQEWHND